MVDSNIKNLITKQACELLNVFVDERKVKTEVHGDFLLFLVQMKDVWIERSLLVYCPCSLSRHFQL